MDYFVSSGNTDLHIETEQNRPQPAIVDELIQLRKAAGLTQQDISDMTGIARPNIARIESKKNSTTIDVLMRYASCLGYDVVLSLKKHE